MKFNRKPPPIHKCSTDYYIPKAASYFQPYSFGLNLVLVYAPLGISNLKLLLSFQ